MIDHIRAFEAKLNVYSTDIDTKNYKYFPNLENITRIKNTNKNQTKKN